MKWFPAYYPAGLGFVLHREKFVRIWQTHILSVLFALTLQNIEMYYEIGASEKILLAAVHVLAQIYPKCWGDCLFNSKG
jgi:hypothetical protein